MCACSRCGVGHVQRCGTPEKLARPPPPPPPPPPAGSQHRSAYRRTSAAWISATLAGVSSGAGSEARHSAPCSARYLRRAGAQQDGTLSIKHLKGHWLHGWIRQAASAGPAQAPRACLYAACFTVAAFSPSAAPCAPATAEMTGRRAARQRDSRWSSGREAGRRTGNCCVRPCRDALRSASASRASVLQACRSMRAQPSVRLQRSTSPGSRGSWFPLPLL